MGMNVSMRILFLSQHFPPESNAPATRLHEHAVRWVRDGHEVMVITSAPHFPEGKLHASYTNRWHQVENIDGIRVVRVKVYITANEGFLNRVLAHLSFMVSALVAGLFEKRPDVVVATSPPFFCALAGWMLSRVRRLPFVFELRDLWPSSIMAVGAMKRNLVITFLEHLELFLYRRANAVISVTHSFREDLVARGIPREKIYVVTNGVDLERYGPTPKDPELNQAFNLQGRFVIGYMGTHGMAHALARVLDAAELLLSRDDIAFFFAGGGAERTNVERLVQLRGLTNVRMIPRQPKEMMPRLWSLCDLSLIPLRNNPLFATVIPSKLFEGMGMGVPALMSLPEGEATSIVCDTGCGVCVPPENPEALARVITALAGDTNRMKELRRASLVAAPMFSRDHQAQQLLTILSKVKGFACSKTTRFTRDL